ncbi:hypothetical protein JNUCC31_20980 [Paenibacillus sp. JNUCC31]|uniref:hypothetical protein n=1 Tax=Paenibacillus sp. JNUCC-31 TaxID=2777983 RepID=UPI00177E071C|nr:hypothetical protein [Paenibacillus sp. JNUCC-31]QOS77263.1 hypothetical protein JNUCC31_20980 [Paenibacillus sp. JNUCC-31]
MMTLLKYDFRRNWNTLLAGLAVLIIVQIGLALFFSEVSGSIIGIIAYVGAGVAIYVKMIKTYRSNIRSYNRRLVPVKGLSHILSPIIFGTLCWLGLIVVAAIHYFIYSATHTGINFASYMNVSGIHLSEILNLLLFLWWVALFSIIIIFLSISIGGSFRFKTGPWISIVAFFLLINLISWLENLIFSGRFNPNELFQFTEESTGLSITSNRIIWSDGTWANIIFEIIVAVILVGVAVYLNNKKVEV